MLCVLPTFQGDISQLVDLLKWIEHLGPCKAHKALIVADASLGYNACLKAKEVADRVFSDTKIICTPKPVSGWPRGANHLFCRAAIDIWKFRKEPWLWLEPDAIPLRTGWLDEIQSAYDQCGKPYMGHIYDCSQDGLPPRLMSAIAVYSKDAATYFTMVPDSPKAFDVEIAPRILEQGAHTNLIYHKWGEKNKPPTFRAEAQPGTNIHSLASIPKEAVIFHRCKDGSLYRVLGKKDDVGANSNFVVVLPFFDGDAKQMLRNVEWQAELGKTQWECLLAYEQKTNPNMVQAIIKAAKGAYEIVDILPYPNAPRAKWPDGPNWAFQNTARKMQQEGKPWLWMESDMVPLTPDWLDKLQDEYTSCKKAFMGSVVPHFGHLNGTSVYPHDLPVRCPKVMQATNTAFDTIAKDQMLLDHHNAIHLMAHVWGLSGGQPHPYTGVPITFRTDKQLDEWIPEGAVTFHRSKDDSLINMLRKRMLATA